MHLQECHLCRVAGTTPCDPISPVSSVLVNYLAANCYSPFTFTFTFHFRYTQVGGIHWQSASRCPCVLVAVLARIVIILHVLTPVCECNTGI